MRDGLLFLLALVALFTPTASVAQEKKDAGDAVQGFQSPFQIGSGVTLLISQEKTALTAAFAGQLTGKRMLNIWQIGLTGATNDEGKALVYSTSDSAAPVFKAKLGAGHSSFLTTDTKDFTAQAGRFLDEAWCLDVLGEISKGFPKPVPRATGQRCDAYFKAVQQSFDTAPPTDDEAAKVAKTVLGTLSPFVANLTPEKRTAACAMFEKSLKSGLKFCAGSAEPLKSAEDQRKVYPDLYDALVSSRLPSFFYTVVGNYQPTLASASYRDVVNGVTDLASKHQWTRLLHRASIDTAFYYRRLSAGVQLAYGETAEIELASVCKIETNGDYRAETCKDAMLGQPDPDNSYSLATVLALDPLIPPTAAALLRPGAQLEIRYEQPSRGDGHKLEITLPLYLAPVRSPLRFVVGIRPTWTTDTTGDDPDRHFSVSFFIGARPGLGS